MNFLERKTAWKNIEFIPLKICIASFYILVGAYFHDFIWKYNIVFIVLFFITTAISLYLWINKMKSNDN